jgi:hypothetical protein
MADRVTSSVEFSISTTDVIKYCSITHFLNRELQLLTKLWNFV